MRDKIAKIGIKIDKIKKLIEIDNAIKDFDWSIQLFSVELIAKIEIDIKI